MKTLSNAELQDAIRYSTECVKNCLQKSNEYHLHLEQLVALLDEQRRRASERVEYTGTPMTTTLERAEFDARVAAQDGPEWRDWDGGTCRPVPRGNIVSIGLANGEKIEKVSAGRVDWGYYGKPTDVACYCDWTAWEQSK